MAIFLIIIIFGMCGILNFMLIFPKKETLLEILISCCILIEAQRGSIDCSLLAKIINIIKSNEILRKIEDDHITKVFQYYINEFTINYNIAKTDTMMRLYPNCKSHFIISSLISIFKGNIQRDLLKDIISALGCDMSEFDLNPPSISFII